MKGKKVFNANYRDFNMPPMIELDRKSART